jgi:hypothetical protein
MLEEYHLTSMAFRLQGAGAEWRRIVPAHSIGVNEFSVV